MQELRVPRGVTARGGGNDSVSSELILNDQLSAALGAADLECVSGRQCISEAYCPAISTKEITAF